ncbi:PAS domain-containing protein [Rhodovibrio salinarum]|uniref:PAS domain-containing protein n=1 Tax=Rhodovibrio salinarum TaxID=1087 RepID=A0A934QLF2_9PROT|nr:PAS domain-containing protein [Rhodovibrio salinarum]MBK1698912.1 PAS domain-containing protein [Rhodovibrio salinarum]
MNTTDVEAFIRDERLAQTLRVWRSLCGNRFAPRRDEIQPFDFRQMLGRLALVDVLEGKSGDARYRYRLMGTQLVAQDTIDLTGKTLCAYPIAEQRLIVRANFDQVLETRKPVYREDTRQDGARNNTYARLVLPLSEDGENVTGLMVGRVVLRRTD